MAQQQRRGLAALTIVVIVGMAVGQDVKHATCPDLSHLKGNQGGKIQYHVCKNCCDISPTCECDQFCPKSPDVWSEGCAVPHVATKGQQQKANFVCPKGYHKCQNCCDVDASCKCDNKCSANFPQGFQCSISPGEDEYTAMSPGASCPGGYTECKTKCDINKDCHMDNYCGHEIPKGFPCTLPKRKRTAGSDGIIRAYAEQKSFVEAEASCVRKGGHLLSLHSSEDFAQMKRAIKAARIKRAVFIGGYEDTGENDWQWIDGTKMDREVLKSFQNKYFGDNYKGNNEDEMAFCSADCVKTVFRNKCPCEGVHDWGTMAGENGGHNAQGKGGIGGYVCRIGGKPSFDSGYYMRKQRAEGRNGNQIQAFKGTLGWTDAERACAEQADLNMMLQSMKSAGIDGAVWVGGYEKNGDHDWQWIDGTKMNRDEIKSMSSKAGIDNNFRGNDEDEMAYCSEACQKTINKPQWGNIVGLHDWGMREKHTTWNINGYVCGFSDSYHYQKPSGKKTFKYFSAPRITWKNAHKACLKKKGDLASIHSDAENAEVYTLAGGDADKKTVWLGMTDEQTEAHWGWTDGSPFDYKKWHKGEPNNLGNEDYGGFYGAYGVSTGGEWADGGNFWAVGLPLPLPGPAPAQGYVCQFGGGSVQGGKIDTVAPQIQYCELYQAKLGWTDARKFCQKKGADLPIIRNEKQNTAVQALLKNTKYGVWLGLNDNRQDGKFEWVDGELAKYTKWAPGEPNGHTRENCINMWSPTSGRPAGTWNDQNCDTKLEQVACCEGGGHGTKTIAAEGCNSLSDFQTMVTRMTQACCEQKGDRCTNGLPQTCSDACSRVVIPFATACKAQYKLAGLTGIINAAVANCLGGAQH